MKGRQPDRRKVGDKDVEPSKEVLFSPTTSQPATCLSLYCSSLYALQLKPEQE